MNVKNNVKSFRLKNGITQHGLSSAVGVSRHTIYLLENHINYNISIKLAFSLSEYLKVKITDLFEVVK